MKYYTFGYASIGVSNYVISMNEQVVYTKLPTTSTGPALAGGFQNHLTPIDRREA